MTEEQKIYILNNYKNNTIKQLSEILNIDRHIIGRFLRENGIEKGRVLFTEEEKEYIFCNLDKTSVEIGKYLNRNPSSIRSFLKNNGIDKSFKFPNIENFIEDYPILSNNELCNKYHLDRHTIVKYARIFGLTTKKEKIKEQVKNKKEKIKQKKEYYLKIKYDYFEKIDSPNKAYFLGLIASDGCVCKTTKNRHILRIQLKNEDGYILNFLLKEFNFNRIPLVGKKYTSLEISSKKIVKDLEKYGIIPNKTWNLNIKNIPSQYYKNFLLGYFDGDGSVSYSKNIPSNYNVSYCGTLSSITSICKMLDSLNLRYSLIKDNRNKYSRDNFYNIVFKNTTEKYIFLKTIYSSDDSVYLIRKRVIAEQFIEIVENNNTNRKENINAINKYAELNRNI